LGELFNLNYKWLKKACMHVCILTNCYPELENLSLLLLRLSNDKKNYEKNICKKCYLRDTSFNDSWSRIFLLHNMEGWQEQAYIQQKNLILNLISI
jgi:hypothetical protein